MNKFFYFSILIYLLPNFVFAEETDIIYLQNTNCSEYSESNIEYELTYEEKMQIASTNFETKINKNEQACDPNFVSEKKNTSAVNNSSSSTVAGGIAGEQSLESNASDNTVSSFGSNSSVDENDKKTVNKGSNIQKNGQNELENGKIPECISRIGGDDEIAMQIKESIAIVTDEDQKKELIKAYSDYKGLNIDPNQC